MKYCCQTWALDSSSFWVQISLLGPALQIRWHQACQEGVCPWLVFVLFCVCVSLHLFHPLFIMCRLYTSCLSQTGWKGWKIADFPEEQTIPAGPIKAICSVRPCLSAPPSSGRTPPSPGAPPDSSSLPKTYGTCPQNAWPRWPPVGWHHGVPTPFVCQQPSGPLPFAISGDQAGGADKSGISRAHQHTIPQALQAS